MFKVIDFIFGSTFAKPEIHFYLISTIGDGKSVFLGSEENWLITDCFFVPAVLAGPANHYGGFEH